MVERIEGLSIPELRYRWLQPDLGIAMDTSEREYLSAANDTEIKVLGEIQTDVMIDNLCLSSKFLVSEQIDEIILGSDWLEEHNCVIDLRKSQIVVGGVPIMLVTQAFRGDVRRVIASGDVEVPSRSEVILEGVVVYPDLRGQGKVWLSDIREVVPGLQVAHNLVSAGGKGINLRAVNVNNQPVKVPKGTELCILSRVRENDISEQVIMPNTDSTAEYDEAIDSLLRSIPSDVPETHKQQLYTLLHQYANVISKNETDMGCTHLIEHHIDTGDARPIHQPFRRMPQLHAQQVDDQVDAWFKQGVIEPACCPWSQGIVLVRKKDGSHRFCLDLQKINNLTKKDVYPWPRIDECIDSLSGSVWFSTLDLRSGYFQVPLAKEDAPKTAFMTRRGSFQFRMMSQGLCNASSTFQRLMNLVLAGLNFESCLCYLDDIIVYAPTLEAHLERLEVVLARLQSANLKIRPDKCSLLQKEVSFLGHIISGLGVRTDPKKIDKVSSWPTPSSVKDVRSFLGLCSYYRKYIKNMAETASALHALTHKGAKFVWTPDCQRAFDELKQLLTHAPVMAYPRDEGTFYLDCDASNHSIGAVLSQMQDGEEKVISFSSRCFSKAESNYCVTRKELLAVVYFTKYFRQYLLGRHFVIRTDHAALQWLRRTPLPIGQQGRWLEQLEAFSFDILHRPGRLHGNSDALSRIPCSQCDMSDNDVIEDGEISTKMRVVSRKDKELDVWLPENLSEAQKMDPEIGEFYLLKTTCGDQKPDINSLQSRCDITKILFSQWDQIEVKNSVMYRRPLTVRGPANYLQIVMPRDLRRDFVLKAHSGMTGGHMGVTRTREQVRRRAYWPGWSHQIENILKSCDACARYHRGKPPRQGPLEPFVAGMPLERVSLDITGPHPKSKSGKVYILTVLDHFTKWLEAIPIPNQESATIAKVLVEQVFSRIGMPMQILTDQGNNFQEKLMTELYKCLKIDKVRTTTYKPSTNGALERAHRTLNAMIGKIVDERQRTWCEIVPLVMAAYRSSKHEATGYSPNFLMLGREVHAPLDLVLGIPGDANAVSSYDAYVAELQERLVEAYAVTREHLGVAAERRKKNYDMRVRPADFQVGQQVLFFYPRRLVNRSPKWQRFYQGPMTVLKQIGPLNYLIRKDSNSKPFVAHADKLKLYYSGSDNLPVDPDINGESIVSNHENKNDDLFP